MNIYIKNSKWRSISDPWHTEKRKKPTQAFIYTAYVINQFKQSSTVME